jgi:hypothetical protein
LGYRRRGFSPLSRYSYLHSHLMELHAELPRRFGTPSTLLYHCINANVDAIHSFGSGLEPRYIVRAKSLDQ